MDNLGNQLHRIIKKAIIIFFDQAELAELTYGAFDIAARSMQSSDQEEIIVSLPVGYRLDKTTIESTRTYKKEKLLLRYQFLAFNQLSTNGLVQLFITVESAFSYIIRAVVLRYPMRAINESYYSNETVWPNAFRKLSIKTP